MGGADPAGLVAHILNDAWMVRHYARGGRLADKSPMRVKRAEAIERLGITVRDAFQMCQDYEALLGAVVDGLRPKDDGPAF